jgi:hypothetical protein
MAVRIPSDLVVDVMNAAGLAQTQMAAARLKAKTGTPEPAGTMFTDALMALREAKPKAGGDLLAGVMGAAEPATARAALQRLAEMSAQPNDAYGQFESFMMRQAFEDMMPPTGAGTFGEGFAGGVWRSMAAEQFASIFTDHGGLGIAEMLRSRAGGEREPASPSAQWPYYNAPAIAAYVPSAAT